MSQRYRKRSIKRLKKEQKKTEKVNLKQVQIEQEDLGSMQSSKSKRWVEEFTHKQQSLKRKRVFVDQNELEHYGYLIQCSNHSVNFKIVNNEKEMDSEDTPSFNPKFTHQVFHKDETVRGYNQLKINIFLSPSTLKPYLSYHHLEKAKNFDNIEETLRGHFGQESLITNKKEFLKVLAEESLKFKPFGKKIGGFQRQVPHQEINE